MTWAENITEEVIKIGSLSIPKPVDMLSEEIELLKEELSTIERQIADLEFQKDSGFITAAEYEKKKRELEAKKKEIEARIKGK